MRRYELAPTDGRRTLPGAIIGREKGISMKRAGSYQRRKEAARNRAIAWQLDFGNHSYSYGEIAYYQNYFEQLGKRWGLLEEFRENGII